MSSAIIPSADAVQPKPAAEEIDHLAERYFQVKVDLDAAIADFEDVEKKAIDLVQRFGIVPPHAESSRRLEGRLTEFTVTTGNSITVDETRVQDLREALKANGREDFFGKLFAQRTRHELVEGADTAIRAECMSKRLTEKVLALFGRCITAKKKKPSLKVRRIAQAKPKRRNKKDVESR